MNDHMKVVAIVGMAGAGKSEVAQEFEAAGFVRVRFGDITEKEVIRRGLPVNETNERLIREEMRHKHGMAAYAIINLPVMDAALAKGSNVVADGLYSWEEYCLLKEHYGVAFQVVAVCARPRTRYARLVQRAHRGLKSEEAAARDRSEIENTNKGGPIAMADYTILNEGSISALREETRSVIARIKNE